jgi:hypothetical protein
MATRDPRAPQAREAELLVHDLTDETLVYDLTRHQAHSLNRTATLVWRRCDGRTTVAEMAALLERELGTPADEDVVWAVLRRLGRAHLLEERITLPADGIRCSRRELMRKLGLVGGLMLVTSAIAPPPALALTCVTSCSSPNSCEPCLGNQPTCTGKNVCCGGNCVSCTSSNCTGLPCKCN